MAQVVTIPTPFTSEPDAHGRFGIFGGKYAPETLMGAIAERLADHVVITSDNPRGEDPLGIIDEIVRGMDKRAHTIEPERSRAIRVAIGMARAGDIVLIAGKGHEQYQDIGGVKHPYSDAAEAKSALEAPTWTS